MVVNIFGPYFLILNVSSTDLAVIIIDDLIKLLQTIINIIKIMIYFVAHVTLSIYALAFGFGKTFFYTIYWLLWIVFHFTCGILGLKDKSTSAFSWLFLMFIVVLYCERSHCYWFYRIARLISLCKHKLCQRLRHRHEIRSTQTVIQVLLENQRNEHREIEPVNRLFEVENQENENEENSLVEADRHRIDDENRRNVERENNVDDQRADLENRENVVRELHNAMTNLDNQRNRDQEELSSHLFLHQHTNRLAVASHGITAVILPAIAAYNMLPLNRNDLLRSNTSRINM